LAGNENSGRTVKLPNLKKEMSHMFAHDVREIWGTILQKAKEGNLEAAIYAIDREFGRPRQEILQDTRLLIRPDDYAQMYNQIINVVNPSALQLPQGDTIEGEVKELDNSNNVDDNSEDAGQDDTFEEK